EEIINESVKYSPHSLRDVPRKFINKMVILAAVSIDGTALQYVPKNLISKEIIAVAISNQPLSLEFVPERKITLEMCYSCFEQDIFAIKFFPKDFLSQEICDKAVKSNFMAFKCIPAEFKTIEMCVMIIKLKRFSINNLTRYEKAEIWGEENIDIIIFDDIPEEKRNNRIVLDNIIHICAYGANLILEWNDRIIEKNSAKEKNPSLYEDIANPLQKETVEYLETKRIKPLRSLTEQKSGLIKKLNNIVTSDAKVNETEIEPIPDNALPVIYEYDKQLAHVLTGEENGTKTLYYITDIHLEHQFEKYIKKYDKENNLTNLTFAERLSADENFHDFYNKTIEEYADSLTEEEIIGLFYREKLVHFLNEKINELVLGVDSSNILLIGGDIADDFDLVIMFYKKLSSVWKGRIIFILGNHELWDGHSNPFIKPLNIRTVDDLVNEYRKVTNSENRVSEGLLNIRFLENDVYIRYKNKKECIISEGQILNSDDRELSDILSNSSLVILGGIGFSGLNPHYNASLGLYRHTITLEQDREYSLRFRRVYDKLMKCVADRNVIVFTHTPVYDWTDEAYNPNWVYINGHTHQNNLIRKKDGTTVLSDNQIGYELKKWKLNSFTIPGWYDPLESYKDGIYKISSTLYKEFNEGRGIASNGCNYEGEIYALKRDGLYMFILGTKRSFCLLVGGQRKRLDYHDVNYYYDKMSIFGQKVRDAIRPYHQALEAISNEIKKFGGTGTIHGCIVDISWFSHIYVNPFDGKITPYWALNMLSRLSFDNIQSLLEQKEPLLIDEFKLEQKKGTLIITGNPTLGKSKNKSLITVPKWVFGTEMYEPSRIMKSVQYVLEQNVIRLWNDDILNKGNMAIADKKGVNNIGSIQG
ncbi:MAG: hypothetical protein HDR22_02990, partial [Lachnospiraceae bacterium]|nr:hypothetical protein [Lachnospiraceae bacterium]